MRRRPAGAGQQARQRGEQRPILRLVGDPRALASEHPELVAQHEDLKLLALARAAKQNEQLRDPPKRQVYKREHASPPVDGEKAHQAIERC
jgi:hypothetical protein